MRESLSLVPLAAAVASMGLPLAVIACVIFAFVPLVPWWIGIPVGLAVAATLVWSRWNRAHDVVVHYVLDSFDPLSVPRVDNLVNGLTLVAGVHKPAVVTFDDDAANAMAISRNGVHTIAVSRGLVERLTVVQLEGVIAQMMVRLRNGDAEAATVAATLYRLPVMGRLFSPFLAVAARYVMPHLLVDGRDLAADQQAVSLTRYPPGLLGALEAIRSAERRPSNMGQQLDHMWLINPGDPHTEAETPFARSPLDLRIDVLAEL